MTNKNLISLITILFIPVTLLLIPCPFLPDLSIALISFFFILCCFINKKFYLFRNKYFYFLFASFLILIGDRIIQFIFDKNILGYKIVVENCVSSFFENKLISVIYLSRSLPLNFGLLILNEAKSG